MRSSVIVYDDRLVGQISPEIFSLSYWPDAEVVPGYSGGRGATLFVSNEGSDWVLKHYHRGGLVGRMIDDGFIWTNLERARSVVEMDVLAAMSKFGLPAPMPVAAHVVRRGFVYTADLITARIPDVTPFSTRIKNGPAGAAIWKDVGKCIAQFHNAGFYHADLSTHNLQIDSTDKIFLLDWDRGRQRKTGSWRKENLGRLHRSCIKVSREGQAHFRPDDWNALVDGYQSA